jgi:succinate-semialdehyde dehydrogenase/glutarate-semialdehyde dehydrogenase
VLLHASIHDEFAARFTAQVRALKVGDGFLPGVQVGPMISQAAVQKLEAHVADAVAGGARVLCGGVRHALGGQFFAPTVLADCRSEMLLNREESFGPLAPLFRFESEEECVALANDTSYGLAAYLYSENASRLWRVAERLETGMVGINCGAISNEAAPFGGVKQSGLGREGSRHGIDEFVEIKYLCWQTN